MRLRRTYQILIASLAFLLLTLQGIAFAHAAQYGDENHEHNGVACAIATIATDQDDVPILPVDAAEAHTAEPLVFSVSYISSHVKTVQGRAPPGRSPPQHS